MPANHPPTPSFEKEGEEPTVPSSSEEGVGGGGLYRTTLPERARQMRNDPTEPEKRLWRYLRGSQLSACKFRRQTVIGDRIVDFFCPEKGVIVEVDGDTHDPQIDAVRDRRMLDVHGFTTVRITNEEVMQNIDGVLTLLQRTLEEAQNRWRRKNHPPAPSFKKEGEANEVPSSSEEGVGGGAGLGLR